MSGSAPTPMTSDATPAPTGSGPPAPMSFTPMVDVPTAYAGESTFAEGIDAAASNAWAGLSAMNSARRHALEGTAPTFGYNLGEAGSIPYDPDTENLPHTPTQTTDAASINAQAAAQKVPGWVPATAPMNQAVANDIMQEHLTTAKNDAIIANTAGGLAGVPGDVYRFATSMGVSMLDPQNAIAGMLPGIGEVGLAAKIGGGLFARAGERAAVGAATNFGIGVALAPLQAIQAHADQQDFDWGETLKNAAYMAAFGAIHGGVSGLFSKDPEVLNDMQHGALARIMQDDPRGVDIQGLLDHADATDAADNLEKFQRQQAGIDTAREGLAPAEPDATVVDRGQELAEHGQRLQDLRDRAQTFFREAEQVRSERVGADNQDAQFSRLDQVNERLSQGIPADERARLNDEKAQLEAGGTNAADLERERSIAQEAGLRSASADAAARARETEGMIERLRAGDEDAQTEAEANRISADRATRIQQLKIDSREEVLQDLMEREVRRYAAKTGVDLQPGEAATAAREVRTASPDEVKDTIASHLKAIAGRSDALPIRDPELAIGYTPKPTPGMEKLRAEAQGAGVDMAARAVNKGADPEVTRIDSDVANNKAATPKMEGIDDKDAAEVSALLADKKSEYDGLVASKQLAEHPSVADTGKAEAERGIAAEAYAKACAFGG